MTAQAREKIYINGKEEQMAAEPLMPFLVAKNLFLVFEPFHTACWRGYFGTWKLENDKLYLIAFHGNRKNRNRETAPINLADLFPGQKQVFADWFSGIIKIEKGDLLEYVHMGYDSVYEQNLFLVFEDGVKVDEYMINNTKS